jgi:hypothetical protein
MNPSPDKIGSPSTIAKVLTSSPAAALRSGLAFVGKEVLWTADILARLTISVLVLRAVSRLTAQWFFPTEIWNQSDQILRGFEGEEETPPVGERPKLLHEHAGWKYYQHRTIYQGQKWPCYLLRPDPCAQCEFYLAGEDGREYCAAVAKVRTLHNDYFRDKDLYDLRDELVRTYGDRRRRANGTTAADPSRPGCL